MSIETFTRPADVTLKQARAELRAHLASTSPGAKIVSMDLDPKTSTLVAQVKTAEFPPKDEPADDGPPTDSPDDGGDDLEDLGPPEPDGDEGGKKDDMGVVVDLLHQIAKAVGVPTPGGDHGLDGPDDLGPTPEVGAPGKGEPLPPPVEEPHKAGPGVFSSLAPKVAKRRSFTVDRKDSKSLSDKDVIAEVTAGFPGYKVARLNRSDNGSVVRLAMVAN